MDTCVYWHFQFKTTEEISKHILDTDTRSGMCYCHHVHTIRFSSFRLQSLVMILNHYTKCVKIILVCIWKSITEKKIIVLFLLQLCCEQHLCEMILYCSSNYKKRKGNRYLLLNEYRIHLLVGHKKEQAIKTSMEYLYRK